MEGLDATHCTGTGDEHEWYPAMDEAQRLVDTHATEQPAAAPVVSAHARGSSGLEDPADVALHGFGLIAASAELSSGQHMITTLLYGPDDQVAQIRVLDANTHQVIAECPPDTIARAQREMMAYQHVARAWGRA